MFENFKNNRNPEFIKRQLEEIKENLIRMNKAYDSLAETGFILPYGISCDLQCVEAENPDGVGYYVAALIQVKNVDYGFPVIPIEYGPYMLIGGFYELQDTAIEEFHARINYQEKLEKKYTKKLTKLMK